MQNWLPWWCWSLIANAAIIATEYLNHTSTRAAGWLPVLCWTLPLIVVAQFSLWASYSGARTLFLAWVVFTLGNSAMRIAMVHTVLDAQVGNWLLVAAGISCMVLGGYTIKMGLQ